MSLLILEIATQTLEPAGKTGGWAWPVCVCVGIVLIIFGFLLLFRKQLNKKIEGIKGIKKTSTYEVLEKEEPEESKQIGRDAKVSYQQVKEKELPLQIVPLREQAIKHAQNNSCTKAEKIFRTYREKAQPDLSLSLLKALVSIYLHQGHIQRAIFFMETEEDFFDKNHEFYETFSRVMRTNKDWEKALYYIKKAISLSPQDAECLSSLGYTYWLKGERGPAIEETEKALGCASNKNDVLRAKNNLAYYYAEQGEVSNEAKAREYAKYAYDNYPKTSELYGSAISTYGYVIMKFARDLQELDNAVTLFHNAIREGFSLDRALEHIRESEIKRKLLSKQS